MSDIDGDGGVQESGTAAMRTALMVAMQIGEKLARLREEILRDAERRDAATARALSARFEAERSAAVAQLEVVDKPDWWDNATTQDVARVAETAEAWKGHDDRAAAASGVIGKEVHDRYGVDVADLVATERARAERERTDAAQLLADADRLDRAVETRNPDLVDKSEDLVAYLEDQAANYEAAAERGGEDGKTPDELRDLAADARNQAQLHQNNMSQRDEAPREERSTAATATRTEATTAYDSAERRDAFASSMEAHGVSKDDIAVRMRADANHARPAEEAVTTPTVSRSKKAQTTTPTRTRERSDRSR